MSPSRSRPSSFRHRRSSWPITCLVVAALAFATPLAFAAKGGNSNKVTGSGGGNKIPGPTTTLVGVVTDSDTSAPIAGANVTVQAITSFNAITDGTGYYSVDVPSDAYYNVAVTAGGYEDFAWSGTIFKGKSYTLDAALDPVYVPPVPDKVTLSPSIEGSTAPGESPTALGGYTLEGSCEYISSSWEQAIDEEGNLEGLAVLIADPDADSTAITLGGVSDYAAHLIQVLKLAPIKESDLPPDVVLQPINEIEKGLQDRNQVVAINPFALEKAADAVLTYSVDTTCGTYSQDVPLVVDLPWVVSTGVRTVPVSVPVMLLAKCGDEFNEVTGEYECQDQTEFSWEITDAPNGSQATLTDATTRSPWFTPDKVGVYTVEETGASGASVQVHVGRYHGVIDPILTLDSLEFGDGRPVGDPGCTSCHDDVTAPDNFATWRNTGHAEAFSDGITTNDHFSERCFACHSVGFGLNGDKDPGGIDDTPNYDAFMQLLADNQAAHDIEGTWATMLWEMPDTARMTNIQCENCHGPQDYTQAHRDQPGAPRVSLASDVCGTCHGEPARHGRFQQWQLSNHADYDLARSRGASSGNCSRCHSGDGFVAWSKLGFDPDEEVAVTWNQDTVQPQVCAACHDPHDTGTTSGSDETDAKVRVMGSTNLLLAGFTATGVGKGATCMTCHNSRAEFLRNDNTWDEVVAAGEATDRPHHGVQADLIMGQNAYFVQTGNRGKHAANIEDVCVTCHMNKTQPPDILSYNQTGTNHTFAADPGICIECHQGGSPNTAAIQSTVNGLLDGLKTAIENSYLTMMESSYPITIGNCGTADGTNPVVAVDFERATRLNITLQDGTACTRVDPEDVVVSDPSFGNLFELSLATNDGAVLKAAWNWTINEEDEGRGVHNPDFSVKSLENAISALTP